jgi:predicted nucleic acid-binding protein
MLILLDTDVILDVLLAREPWLDEASVLWRAHEEGRIRGSIAATTVTNIFYVVRHSAGLERAGAAVGICLETFEVIPVDRPALEAAATMPGSDFEDNVQIACALHARLDLIVTRNTPDFAGGLVAAVTPTQALTRLGPAT